MATRSYCLLDNEDHSFSPLMGESRPAIQQEPFVPEGQYIIIHNVKLLKH